MKNKNLYYLTILDPMEDNVSDDTRRVHLELSHVDSDVIACGSMDSPPENNAEYICMFIRAPYAFRRAQFEKVLTKNDSSDLRDAVTNSALVDAYFETAEQLKYAIHEVCPSAEVLCNLTFGDFCILDTDKAFRSFDIKQTIRSFFKNHFPQYVKSDDTVQMLNDQIFKRFSTQFLYKRNPHYAEYADILSKLAGLQCGSDDRAMECTLLSALLLRTVLDETAVRWVYASGDLRHEDPETNRHWNAAHMRLMRSLHRFINQASSKQIYSDQIWSLIFITRALLASFIGRAEQDALTWDLSENQSADEQETILERFHSFYGFIPLIDSRVAEVSSYFTDHLSPDYHFAFLTIPQQHMGEFWSFFPAFIHEFYHYVPPPDRRSRNNIILKLALYEVLNPIYSITENIPVDISVYQQFVDTIFECIEHMRSSLIHPTDECSENVIYQMETSMKYLDLMRALLPDLDFSFYYDYATYAVLSEHADLSQLKNVFSSVKAKCVALWDDNAIDFVQTFAVALKEIRADISMCRILDLDLDKYIKIMALESSFAILPARRAADSVFFRFGFMTRYLFFGKSDSFAYSRSALREWKDKCFESIDSLSKYKIEDLEVKQNNLKAYLEEYEEITVYSESENQVIVIFENMLRTSDNEGQSLIDGWEKWLNRHKGHAFVRDLKELYDHYTKQSNTCKRALFEYQTRIVFRDLFEHFADIDRP